jgi:hypothetical protein
MFTIIGLNQNRRAVELRLIAVTAEDTKEQAKAAGLTAVVITDPPDERSPGALAAKNPADSD